MASRLSRAGIIRAMEKIEYERLEGLTDQAVNDLNKLVAQLSRHPRAMEREHYQRLLDEAALFVARDGERIVGCVEVVVDVVPSKVKGWLEELMVDDDYRGQGIARELVRMAVDYAREAGCVHLNLTSGDDRGVAHAVYEALGFYRRESAVYRLDLN